MGGKCWCKLVTADAIHDRDPVDTNLVRELCVCHYKAWRGGDTERGHIGCYCMHILYNLSERLIPRGDCEPVGSGGCAWLAVCGAVRCGMVPVTAGKKEKHFEVNMHVESAARRKVRADTHSAGAACGDVSRVALRLDVLSEEVDKTTHLCPSCPRDPILFCSRLVLFQLPYD